jgi:putative photosynthetic complex assembly protein 2
MTEPWIAALFALFVWWFSTGAILWAVRRADKAGHHALLVCTGLTLPLLGLGVWGFFTTLNDTGLGAVYGSFLSALAIWGWIEIAFLTGTVTGPNHYDCPRGVPEFERFIRAWGTIAYHEMLIVAVLIAMWLAAHDAANGFGLWTFTILFLARISAKLNLYFGVPRINTEFLPHAISHLASHFRISRLNWLFPISITGLSFAVACWIERLLAAPDPGEVVGFALLGALTALALLEHWLMVLPLPDAKLWRWMLPAPHPEQTSGQPEGHHGI